MPRFSVVIACYNAEDTLPETVQSLLNQTETDWEAICVDDGSSDATLGLLHALAARDRRFRVIHQDNAGPSRARNVGVAQAQGDWVAFLDADDIWCANKLAHIATVASDVPDAAAIYGRISFFDPRTGKTTTFSTVTEGPTSVAALLGENPVCTLSNLCVRRDNFHRVGGFREDMRFSEDLEFLIRLVAKGEMLFGTPVPLVRYRASVDGLSANLMQMHDGWREALQSAGTALTSRQRARAEALHLRYLARRALRLNLPPQVARTLALSGLRLAPIAFLGDRHRGPLTLASCLLAQCLPPSLRRQLFA